MKRKWILVIVIFGILLLGVVVYSKVDKMNLRTDSGWDSSYDSGGSWDSGGWDSGGWDNDYDYDYDFDSNNSSGSGFNYSDLDSEDFKVLIKITIFYIILFIVIAIFYKGFKKLTDYTIKNKYRKNNLILKTEEKELNANLVEEYIGKHSETIKKELFEIYKNIQISWMNFDYDKLRTLCGDELYNTYKTQLEALKLKGQQNIMEHFVLHSIYFLEPKKLFESIEVSVVLKVYQYDYVVDKNKKIIHGSDTKPMHMTYKLVYEFKHVITELCPNCNAKIKPETSKCDHCGSVIIQGKGKFVLTRKEALDQK